MTPKVTVLDIITLGAESGLGLNLVCKAGRQGLDRPITRNINRPGLALNGIFIGFGEDRVQLFGRGEVEFLHVLEKNGKLKSLMDEFLSHNISCCIVSHTLEQTPPDTFIRACEENNCPVLYSELNTADLSINLFRTVNDLFAPRKLMHGVLMEVYDLGVFIRGESGIGKSEIALELLEKGRYRLIADDAVLMKKIDENTVIGTSQIGKQYHHNLEIRGLGFVNVAQIYGIGTVLNSDKVSLVIDLQEWDATEKEEDRLEKIQFTEILGVKIPCNTLRVRAGRNISLLIETAAMKHRLREMGFHGKENPYLW